MMQSMSVMAARSRTLLLCAMSQKKSATARTSSKTQATSVPLLQRDFTLRVALQLDAPLKPKRLVRVSDCITLQVLAEEVLAPAMGWSGGHLYVFETANEVRARRD